MRSREAYKRVTPRKIGLAGLAVALCLLGVAVRADNPPSAGTLDRPEWQPGETWTIETVTDRTQGREAKPAVNPARVRWQFKVTNVEKVAGQDCYRIDVECLAAGRIRPKATVWCDKDTLFLRQFQTQLAFNGRYQTIQESYDCGKGQYSPVVPSINALPLAMPAFLPKGSKALGEFSFTSQPLPAGSKDPTILRFSQKMSQDVRPADPELLQKIYHGYSKALNENGQNPVTQVTLESGPQKRDKVVQLWQAGSPWPLYTNNGRTQSWLVSASGK
jgi:hypothetical protein